MPKAEMLEIGVETELSAEELFTDREIPRKAFWDIYNSMSVEEGVFEVLTYYGIGGIGKSSLLTKLSHELGALTSGKKMPNYAFFSFEGNASKEEFLFGLSRQMMLYDKKLYRKLRFPLFDYAFQRVLILERKSLKEFTDNAKSLFAENTLVKIFSKIGGHIIPGMDTAVEVLDDICSFAVSKTYEKERKTGKYAAIYNEIDTDPVDKLKSKLQKYFRLDVQEYFKDNREPYVVFVDGYENYVSLIKNDNLAEGVDDWFSKELVKLPNVLWVIAGREKLNWDKNVLPDDHQHRVGDLSELDATEFFRKCGIVDKELVYGLYKLTNGTPAYLDLCKEIYKNIVKSKVPTIEDFGKDTRALVERYFQKMGDEDKKIMIMLSFLPKVWDIHMAEQVAIALGYKAYLDNIHKLIKLSVFEKVDKGVKIHETSRSVIREFHKDRQERIVGEIIQYLARVLLESTDSVDYMQRCMQFAEVFELCEKKVLSDEDIDAILVNISSVINSVAEYRKGEYILSILGAKLEECGYLPDNVVACKNLRCVNMKNSCGYERALEIAEASLEYIEKHMDEVNGLHLLNTYLNMGDLYLELGDYENAEFYLNIVYKIEKDNTGEKSIRAAGVKRNIARLYLILGKYKEAKEMFEQVKDIYAELEDDEDILDILSCIAATNNYLGEKQEACDMFFQIYEKTMAAKGKEHPDTVVALANYAQAYVYVGDFACAIELAKQAYESCKKKFGEENNNTIGMINCFAMCYVGNKDYKKALEQFEKAYNLSKKSLGEKNHVTVDILTNLAKVQVELQEYAEAKKYYKQLYDIKVNFQNEEATVMIKIISKLAEISVKLSEFNEAKVWYEQLYELVKKENGENSIESYKTLNSLAYVYCVLEDFESVIKLYTPVFDTLIGELGYMDECGAYALYQNVQAHLALGINDIKLLELFHSFLVENKGKEDPDTMEIARMLLELNSMIEE